ncbi:sulfatase-like hydrolase/transferase [Halogeometricum sp. CBA1124]|uniref:sulfatase-like hydrolase/transferase n=1 Tax=Halogeometricum sp. CBA1124 TaxID=2668071 RepID=UPI001E38E8CF|nr:sulfatase-like hydrolase/transferase [Halogeometricum sp. CBA1124]
MSRDIVWITLESVRQDHTSLGGHHRDTTPFLSSLADRTTGAAFERCFSHDVWTRASSASILTGLASSAHRTWTQENRLSSDVPTVPEALRDAGYRTACVSPNPQLSDATGLARGFDHFHYLGKDTLVEEAGIPTVLRYLTKLNTHSAGYTTDTGKHSVGYVSNAIAKRHVREAAANDEDLFLYTHLGDSHHPYYPPKPYQDLYADDFEMSVEEALDLVMEMSDDLHGYIARGVPFTEDEWNALQAMYDATIRYVDDTVRSLVEYAEERLDDPIVVVTADHGELFGEKGMLAHMVVADDAVSHAPPRRLRRRRRRESRRRRPTRGRDDGGARRRRRRLRRRGGGRTRSGGPRVRRHATERRSLREQARHDSGARPRVRRRALPRGRPDESPDARLPLPAQRVRRGTVRPPRRDDGRRRRPPGRARDAGREGRVVARNLRGPDVRAGRTGRVRRVDDLAPRRPRLPLNGGVREVRTR